MPVCYVIRPTFSLLGGLVSTILLGLLDAKIAQDFPEKLLATEIAAPPFFQH
jgi:hypothetical protein